MIGSTLTEEGRNKLCDLLQHNLDIFAWNLADMTGVPRHIAEHHLNVREGCSPVRQKKSGQAADRNQAIQEEVGKLMEARIMKEQHYHDWLSNPMMVKKHDDSWRMCIDFKDLNKACPKDEEGMFLGYKVNTKGLKVFPDKVDVVLSLPSLNCLKDVQNLNGKLASLNRFLAKSAQKSLPFFKMLKKCTKKSDFYWTAEDEEAFKQVKQLIAKLPMLAAPMEKRELIVYLAATKENILADFIVERPEKDSPDTLMEAKEELPESWILFTDGSSFTYGSGAGMILTNPKGMEFIYALRFRFDVTNNEAEYEALIFRLRIVEQMSVKNLQAIVDS
ncbi:reverse transcriptase domain-containing protein [Tanacetum coccineum]